MNRVTSAAESEGSFSSRPSSAGAKANSALRLDDQSLIESKNARIAQRKSRIEAARQARLKPVQGAAETTKQKAQTISQEVSPSQGQINSSVKHLENVKLTGFEAVTNIRVAAEARQSMRRFEEKKKMETWRLQREQDANFEKERMVQIDQEWDNIEKLQYPDALRSLMLKQKKECDRLIDSKNKLIAEYMAEMKGKDDDYVKELKRQTEEIDSLLQRMRGQYKSYQDTVRLELDFIEKSFMAERTELLEKQMQEIDEIQTRRRTEECRNLEEKAKKLEDAIRSLEDLRVRDAEDYNVVKIKLETDVQVLEQQLQQMRATYQLNMEKLEYNYQVLKKRDDENMIVINHQKRKITKSTDVVNNLKAKLTGQEKSYQNEYQNLAEEYKRITEQVKHLQKKFKHFQMADQKRFQEIWSMNEEEVKELMRKVLQADQIIHEQQLGLPWKAPLDDLHYFGLDKDESKLKLSNPLQKSNTMEEAMNPLTKKSNNSTSEANPNEAHRSSIQIPILASQELVQANDDLLDPTLINLNEKVQAMTSYQGFSTPVKKILDLLCSEAGFLVEDKLNKLLVPLHSDERSLMKLDAIFKALGLETLEDIQRLTSYFIKADAVAPDANQRRSDPNIYNTLLINANDVVRAIKRFLEDSKNLAKNRRDHLGLKGNGTAAQILQSTLNGSDLNASLASQRAYWERATHILRDDNYELWKRVYQEMSQYHNMLVDRWQLHEEINAIKGQNEEMKTLLRQYLTAKVNDELQIPPTKVLLGQ